MHARHLSESRLYVPPISPHKLIQELVFYDPWMLTVICIMLNKTSPKQVKNVIFQFFKHWPNPQVAAETTIQEVSEVIRPLGLFRKRAEYIIALSKKFLTDDWKQLTEFKGVGTYGNDAYKIFCCGEWKTMIPSDHKLNDYHNWIATLHKSEKKPETFKRINIENDEVWCAIESEDMNKMDKEELKWWKGLVKKRRNLRHSKGLILKMMRSGVLLRVRI
uniref:Methyl-CpG-binding domain protein 4 n=1 Tax=Arcella intermedia TaxID=1963864 RepID=A0A6B2LFD7_9EUKA